MQLSEELATDQNNLELEWMHLPLQVLRFQELVATADDEIKMAKMTLQRVEARLIMEIKSTPDDFFLKDVKPTEMLIRSAMIKTKNWKQATMSVIKAEKKKKEYQVVLIALDYKRDALKGLTSLYNTEYFSTPRSSESGRKYNKEIDEIGSVQTPEPGSRNRPRMRSRSKQEKDNG